MQEEFPAVTVVIPNYNGKQLLSANLPGVCKAAAHYPGEVYIIVVDDGSSEAGTQELAERFSPIKYIQHAQNKGFAEAILTGVKQAETELLFLLNSDVLPMVDSIQPLVSAIQDDMVFAVSPLILNEDSSANRYSLNLKFWYCFDLKDVRWKMEQVVEARMNGPIEHLYCSGGSMLTRRSRFLAMGGFAPIFKPYYAEDKDLGIRAWRQGWRSIFEPNSRVVHQEFGTIGTHEKRDYVRMIQRRNSFFFEWSHLSLLKLLGYRSPFWLKQIIGRALRGDLVYLKGLGLALVEMKSVLQHRSLVFRNSDAFNFEQLIDRLSSLKRD